VYDAVVAGVFRSPVPAVHRPWLGFGFVATWLAVVRSGSGARMVARKKTKSVPKAKAAEARSKPATKIKPKTATMPRSKRPAKSKPKTPATTPPKPAVSVPRPVTPAPSNPQTRAPSGFQVEGSNDKAPFTLKLHRGDGMTLIAMNWKNGQPPQDFVGFAIEYHEPGGNQYYTLNNRLGLLDAAGNVDPTALSTLKSPIQKCRWVHFPRNLVGDFKYRVTPMFMDAQDKLSTGEPQEVAIQLARETYPGIANVTFTRGFVSSQAFVDRYVKNGPINTLVAPVAAKGLDFTSTHPDSTAALAWMGFEARAAILQTLDQAIADKAEVCVVAYDFNLPEVVDRLEKLGSSLKIIIDDSKGHGGDGTAETEAEGRLVASAGRANVLRQHMGSLQHNKTIAVNGSTVKKVVCGSTNLSWRGFFVQANNAFVLTGQTAADLFFAAFDNYFNGAKNDVAGFGAKPSADWNDLGLAGIDAKVAFSPHSAANAKLGGIAADIKTNTTSSLLYSLAFLYETPGVVLDAIKAVTADRNIFVYGISDKKVGGLDVQDPSGKCRACLCGGARRRRAGTLQVRADRRHWHAHASQVHGDRLRQADGARLSRFLQFLHARRPQERRESHRRQGPAHRGVLHDRGAQPVRPLLVPRPPQDCGGQGPEAASRQASARPRRNAVVGR